MVKRFLFAAAIAMLAGVAGADHAVETKDKAAVADHAAGASNGGAVADHAAEAQDGAAETSHAIEPSEKEAVPAVGNAAGPAADHANATAIPVDDANATAVPVGDADATVIPIAMREVCTTMQGVPGLVRTECRTETLGSGEEDQGLRGICITLYGRRTCY